MNKQTKELLKPVIAFAKEEGLPGIVEKATHIGTSIAFDIVAPAKSAALLNKFAKLARSNEMGQFLKKVTNFVNKAPEIGAITAEGVAVKASQSAETAVFNEAHEAIKQGEKTITSSLENNVVNQTFTAILKDGYYEVNGFKFTEYYYEKLWREGRKAPTLIAKDILKNATIIKPDSKLKNFFRYEFNKWEMVYNPTTKEIWHLQPISKIR